MFFTKAKKKINIILINILFLYFLLYLVEIFFQIKNKTFLDDSKFSYRQKLKNEKGADVNLAFAPYKLLDHTNLKLLPLSGISNSETILCKDDNKFYVYRSDKFGFNNDNIENSDLLIIGDSYVHGLCLEQKNNLVNQLNKIGVKSKNLGMMASGPLLEYAIFKEYSNNYKFKTLVWLFNPDNDFDDFNNEIKNEILVKYLKDIKFSQNLVENNLLKDDIINNYFNYDKRRLKEFVKHYHIDLKLIRNTIQNYIDIKIIKKNINKKNISLNNEENLRTIVSVLLKTKEELNKSGKNFIVIFNSLAPYILFPDDKNSKFKKKLFLENTRIIKKKLLSQNIIFYDFNNFIKKNYDIKSIDTIYKKNIKGYDHFTKKGNEILAKKILVNIDKLNKNE